MSRRLPIFVYGTLRPGHGNAVLWQGRAVARCDGTARIVGYRLTTHGHFPYLIPATASITVGCLIVPAPEHYDVVLADMDHLEGVPHHYDRVPVAVLTHDDAVTAWTYRPPRPELREALLDEVEGNDWNLHNPPRQYRRSTERTTR